MGYRFDSELALHLDELPAVSLEDVGAARAYLNEFLGDGAPAPDVMERLEVAETDASAPSGPGTVRLRTYVPRVRRRPTPGVVFLHSGGFVLGSLEIEHEVAETLAAEADCVVVSVDYRLAPEHPYPAALEDCRTALCWLADPDSGLDVDPERIAVAGHSAGGGLAAALSIVARDQGGPCICFQMLDAPVLDDRLATPSATAFVDTPVWNRDKATLSWRYYLDGAARDDAAYAAPARVADLSGLPAAYIATAEFDPLRDEGILYALRLLQAGVPTELHSFPGTFHGSRRLERAEVSRRQSAEMIAALRRALHGIHG